MSISALGTITGVGLYNYANLGLSTMPAVPDDVIHLTLDNNDIRDIDTESFMEFSMLSLLSIKENSLSDFPDLSVVNVTLRSLYLSTNDIGDVPDDMLSPLCSLEVLVMNRNKLTAIPNVCITECLKTLSLAFNDIVVLGRVMLSDCRNLEDLLLNGNNLVAALDILLPRTLLALQITNTLVEHVTLECPEAGCSLETLEVGPKLEHFPNLSNVSSSLKTLKLLKCKTLTDMDYSHLANIQVLSLAGSEDLQIFPLPAMNNLSSQLLPNLTTLNLDNHQLYDSQLDMPRGLHELQNLVIFQCSHNNLEVFPDLEYSKLSIRIIELNHNFITKLPAEKLQTMLNLEKLHLESNRLQHLDDFPYQLLTSLNYLDVRGMTFSCRCLFWLKERNMTTLTEDAPCTSPQHVISTPWNMINQSSLNCKSCHVVLPTRIVLCYVL